jgi:cytochrome c oxidase subunit 2
VGQQLKRRPRPALRRAAVVALLGALLFLAGCSAETQHQWENLAMPDPATEQAEHIFSLWRYSWIAALVTGAVVWGLIFWVVVRYRRKSDDEIPVQTRYNLPLEIFYTIAPIMMVIVFFYWTVKVQDEAIALEPEPDTVVDVVGQQWSWTFNYTEQGEGGATPYTSGTASQIPTLVLPVDQTVQFNLHSPDVIHNFGVPAFLMKMDVIPGRVNQFQVTPTTIGTYAGKCFELCGTYHSRMLFNVKVVSQADYDAYLLDLADQGWIADEPLLGGSDAITQAGLDDEDTEGSTE